MKLTQKNFKQVIWDGIFSTEVVKLGAKSINAYKYIIKIRIQIVSITYNVEPVAPTYVCDLIGTQ